MSVFKFYKLLRLMDINEQLRITKRGIAVVPFGQISITESVWEEMERSMCGCKLSQNDYVSFLEIGAGFLHCGTGKRSQGIWL